MAHTTLSVQELEEQLGGSLRARAVFLLADTCRSGALANPPTEDLSVQLSRSGVYVLASSSRYAYESPQRAHGAFTLALLRALSRKDLTTGGVIQFHKLASGVRDEMEILSRPTSKIREEPVSPLEGRSVLMPVAISRS